MRKIYYLVFFVFITQFVLGQEQELYFCGTDDINRRLMEEDPSFKQQIQQFDEALSRMLKSGNLSKFYKVSDEVYEIPVVVHIFYEGNSSSLGDNISDEDVRKWIDFTNKIFAGTAPGFDGPENGGIRMPIRLVLAKRDMYCNSTTGIVRIDGSKMPNYVQGGIGSEGITDNDLYRVSRWDPYSYYNIYVVNKIEGASGFAYYPGSSKDGTVLDYCASVCVGSTALAHEIGHAMGLYHTFNGANSSGGECPASTGDCTIDDDMVCDTEPTQSLLSVYPCPTSSDINPCTGTYYEGVQYNIMGYGTCPRRFTLGQTERVLYTLHNDEMRKKQLISKGKQEPPVEGIVIPVSACVPAFISDPENIFHLGPANVSFGDIEYQSGGYSGDGFVFYIDHATKCYAGKISTVIPSNSATPLTISVNLNIQDVRAYIDFNNDGVFDEVTETVFSERIEGYGLQTVDVTPPSNAVLNRPLRMRVIADWIGGVTISPCYNPLYGQVEDFSVTISSTLGTEDIAANANDGVKVYTKNKSVFVHSDSSDIEQIEVYNLSGQKISGINKLSQPLYEISFNHIQDKIVVIKIMTADKKVTTQKVILH